MRNFMGKIRDWYYEHEETIVYLGVCFTAGATLAMIHDIGYANGIAAGRSEVALAVLDRVLPAADAVTE